MRRQTPGRLQILGIAFVCVVVAVVIYTHQLVIPLFLGLLTVGKSWIKTLTPKLALLLVKNGVVIQLRRMIMQASAHLLVKSHRPWRRLITSARLALVRALKQTFANYLQMPLWMRTGIAIALLIATAGSSFAVFALLIIPQPVLNWFRQRVMATLNKLGATKLFSAIWQYLVPASLRQRWHMHVKWTLGRQQVRTAKHLHNTVIRKAMARRQTANDPLNHSAAEDNAMSLKASGDNTDNKR
ncbi:MAG: hypothetical protein AB8B87_25310 [Granulosicoccus sp.]